MPVHVTDTVTLALRRLARSVSNLQPVMRQIEQRCLKTAVPLSWARSGLKARTGELKRAVRTEATRRQAKIIVDTTRGRDLVLPKLFAHEYGMAKGAYRRKARVKVTRKGKTFTRRNPGAPWGDVRARPFLPDAGRILAQKERMRRMIEQYLLKRNGG